MSGNVIFESQIPTAKKRGCCIRFPLVTKLFEIVLLHEDIKQRDPKMPQSGVGSMQGKNTGNMPSAMCASSMDKSLDPTPI